MPSLSLDLSLSGRHHAFGGSGAPQKIGGVTIGDAGSGIYSGFTLNWGDDFNSLDIVRPSNGRGKYFTTRTYLAGARGSDTLLGNLYDTDPYHTGYNDSNRGAAVNYNNMSVSASALTLQARVATTQERAHFQGSGRVNVASMISGAGAVGFYPSTAGTGDIIIEARIKFSAKSGNPAGWHPTFWTQSCMPTPAIDSDETDFEGNSQGGYLHHSNWTGGNPAVSSVSGVVDIYDNAYHTVTLLMNKTNTLLYIDGVLTKTGVWDSNAKNKLASFLITNHIYGGSFEGENYSQTPWDSDPDGASMTIDWVRLWSKKSHYKPLQSVSDANAILGVGTTITLPSAMALWGDASVTEYIQAQMTEENEPGASHSTPYSQFPAGVSYNSGTRVLTVNPTDTKSGRLNFIMYGYKPDGSTCEPLRFCVNFAPVINVSALNINSGSSVNYDLYAACDCGQLVSNSNGQRAKTITVDGLTGSGLSYNDATGLITGTAVAGTYNLTITCTNSIGQTTTKNVTMTIGAVTAFASDLFNGTVNTSLLSHTADTGGSWTGHSSLPNSTSNPVKLDGVGGLMNPNASAISTLLYYNAATPTTPDYSVKGKINIKTVVADEQIGVCGRLSTSALTFYVARYNTNVNAVQLYKSIAGTLTLLGSYSATWAAGETHDIELKMVGSTISVLVDGVERISVTDNSITTAGKAGIRMYNTTAATPTTSLHLDEFNAI